jgi:hypothetical protein
VPARRGGRTICAAPPQVERVTKALGQFERAGIDAAHVQTQATGQVRMHQRDQSQRGGHDCEARILLEFSGIRALEHHRESLP